MAEEHLGEQPEKPVSGPGPPVEPGLTGLDTAPGHPHTAIERFKASLDRSEAARRRSEAAIERARASRRSAQAALARVTARGSHGGAGEQDRTVHERERIADEREAAANERDRRADDRDRIADTREVEADRREGHADDRERLMDARERLVDEQDRLVMERTIGRDLQSRMIAIRTASAERAEKMADEAEAYAAYLERSALNHDTDKRLALAQREREIAAVERRNALKLRQAGPEHVRLEGLPRLTPKFPQHE